LGKKGEGKKGRRKVNGAWERVWEGGIRGEKKEYVHCLQ